MINTCVICSLDCNTSITEQNRSLTIFECPKCGSYQINNELKEDIPTLSLTDDDRLKLSALVRKNHDLLISLSADSLKRMLAKTLIPSVYEKTDILLLWISKQANLGIPVPIDIKDPKFLSICWAHSDDEIRYIHEYLVGMGFLKYRASQNNLIFPSMVTVEGLTYLDNRKKNKDSNIGFCAMWFDSSLDILWEEAIKPAIQAAGYNPVRIDKLPHNEGVVDEIISCIRKSKFIVADITKHRNGVYFEAGYAKGFGLEVIFSCEKENFKDAHFDVKHYNLLLWEHDKLDKFKTDLHYRIESTLGRGTS